MYEIIGYLILCPLAFAIGYVCCWDRIAEQEKREAPLKEEIFRFRLDEAYRAGQQNPDHGFHADAHVPLLQADDMAIQDRAWPDR